MGQHKVKWAEYQALDNDERKEFFIKREAAEVTNMCSFVQPTGNAKCQVISKQKCIFLIDCDIIDKINGDMLFNVSKNALEGNDVQNNTVEKQKKNEMKQF